MTTPEALEAQQTALLVMDYQPSILGGLSDADELVGRCAETVASARAAGIHVAFVRVAFKESDLDGFPSHSAMGARIKSAGPAMHADAPTTQVRAELGATDEDVAVRKVRVGSFSTTDLDTRLANKGVTRVLLAGVHTSGVVLTTVREAHDLDYEVVVLSDLCGDPDQSVHDFLVEQIFPKQGTVMTAREALALHQPVG
ncbi:cysteine hydrolase family protein [Nocardioides acrostichi]|uniref:Cysteine hydrolase n=1 Tax=Nocardioides acrostichi TaxID=2784339 RepID=A0A930Y8P4_9ACTN|nr:cysteine hydrolase [Nocardioides acrostichi]MBF4163281.1 cysteine hydrolase [Nocardioides acrostichi]